MSDKDIESAFGIQDGEEEEFQEDDDFQEEEEDEDGFGESNREDATTREDESKEHSEQSTHRKWKHAKRNRKRTAEIEREKHQKEIAEREERRLGDMQRVDWTAEELTRKMSIPDLRNCYIFILQDYRRMHPNATAEMAMSFVQGIPDPLAVVKSRSNPIF